MFACLFVCEFFLAGQVCVFACLFVCVIVFSGPGLCVCLFVCLCNCF